MRQTSSIFFFFLLLLSSSSFFFFFFSTISNPFLSLSIPSPFLPSFINRVLSNHQFWIVFLFLFFLSFFFFQIKKVWQSSLIKQRKGLLFERDGSQSSNLPRKLLYPVQIPAEVDRPLHAVGGGARLHERSREARFPGTPQLHGPPAPGGAAAEGPHGAVGVPTRGGGRGRRRFRGCGPAMSQLC